MAFCATFPADVRLIDAPHVIMMASSASFFFSFGWHMANTDPEVSCFGLASGFVPRNAQLFITVFLTQFFAMNPLSFSLFIFSFNCIEDNLPPPSFLTLLNILQPSISVLQPCDYCHYVSELWLGLTLSVFSGGYMETSISQVQLRRQECSLYVHSSSRVIKSSMKPAAAEPHFHVFHLGLPKSAQ